MDAVMKTVHDYGHNHSNPVASRVPEKLVEAPEHYYAHITDLLVQEDFAQLEKIAQQNRVENGRLLGGAWKNHEFFVATAYPTPGDEPAYGTRIELLKRWIAAYPESSAARISLADLYTYYAFFARGEGICRLRHRSSVEALSRADSSGRAVTHGCRPPQGARSSLVFGLARCRLERRLEQS